MQWFLLNSFGEMCFLDRVELQMDAKHSNFEIFEVSSV